MSGPPAMHAALGKVHCSPAAASQSGGAAAHGHPHRNGFVVPAALDGVPHAHGRPLRNGFVDSAALDGERREVCNRTEGGGEAARQRALGLSSAAKLGLGRQDP